MLEKLLEILIGLLVASGSAGVAVAHDAAAAADPQIPSSVVEKLAWARTHAAELRRDAANDAAEDATAQGSADGRATASGAIQDAMELAPDAADHGLGQAWNAVTSGGASIAEAAPDDVSTADQVQLPDDRP